MTTEEKIVKAFTEIQEAILFHIATMYEARKFDSVSDVKKEIINSITHDVLDIVLNPSEKTKIQNYTEPDPFDITSDGLLKLTKKPVIRSRKNRSRRK